MGSEPAWKMEFGSVVLEVYASDSTPPDRRVGPASPGLWVRFAGGPSGWWAVEESSLHRFQQAVEGAAHLNEAICVLGNWWPEAR